jgi:hypothetical protein
MVIAGLAESQEEEQLHHSRAEQEPGRDRLPKGPKTQRPRNAEDPKDSRIGNEDLFLEPNVIAVPWDRTDSRKKINRLAQ